MNGSVSNRFAARSLLRHVRRTSLSVLGVGIGAAIGLIGLSWVRGEEAMIVRAAAGSGVGHLRIVPAGWEESRDIDLRLQDWEGELAQVRQLPDVAVATPHARVRALLGFGTRTGHVELTGVDPATEQQALRLVRNVSEGRYLRVGDSGTVVIGRALATRLDAELDDELVATAVDHEGEMRSSLLVVVGIVETGSREIDAVTAHVPLADIEALSGLAGASDVTILVENHQRIADVHAALASSLPDGDQVLTWAQVSPELLAGLEVDSVFMDLTVFIILLVVLLGVASAQLTGVLERRKEFAVLAALGMRGHQLVRAVVVEGVVLGLTGAAVALIIAVPVAYHLATEGLNFAEMVGEDGLAMSGVLMDPIFYADFGWWLVPYAIALSLVATVIASLYPAWYAARTDPAQALRVEA